LTARVAELARQASAEPARAVRPQPVSFWLVRAVRQQLVSSWPAPVVRPQLVSSWPAPAERLPSVWSWLALAAELAQPGRSWLAEAATLLGLTLQGAGICPVPAASERSPRRPRSRGKTRLALMPTSRCDSWHIHSRYLSQAKKPILPFKTAYSSWAVQILQTIAPHSDKTNQKKSFVWNSGGAQGVVFMRLPLKGEIPENTALACLPKGEVTDDPTATRWVFNAKTVPIFLKGRDHYARNC
jgi:hypothetical protein